MKKNKKYFITIVISSLFLTQQMYAMDGMARRRLISRELPEINNSESDFMEGVLTYKDDNFIEKFLELVGPTSVALDENSTDKREIINKSIQIKAGHWRVSDKDVFMSTGNVHECVAITVQHQNPSLIAMYHYYQKADEDFVILDKFLSEIKNKAAQLAINVSDLAVFLVSSYVSSNFLIIKRVMQDNEFKIQLCHVRPRAYLARDLYVYSHDAVISPGRLILASPKVLRVHQYEYDYPGDYDSDLPVDYDECVIS